MTLILFILATVGLTNILVHGTIFEKTLPIRPWLKKKLHPNVFVLFECYECMGTWAGFVCGAMIVSTWWPIILACGFAGGLLANWNNLLFEYISSKIEFVINTGDDCGETEERPSQD